MSLFFFLYSLVTLLFCYLLYCCRVGSARFELPELHGVVKVSERSNMFQPERKNSGTLTASSVASLNDKVICLKCNKTVYKAEELRAINNIYHKSCFRCGGIDDEQGCNRVLTLSDFVQHSGLPFCNACFNKRKIDDMLLAPTFKVKEEPEPESVPKPLPEVVPEPEPIEIEKIQPILSEKKTMKIEPAAKPRG